MDKFAMYFAASVDSYWIVLPAAHTVLVYHDLNKVKAEPLAKINFMIPSLESSCP